MLYPQTNAARAAIDLSGVWDFRLDGQERWQPIAVPASYNDQSADPAYRAHVGLAFYRTRFTVPAAFAGKRVSLRFDAVTHDARVSLNGAPLCAHRGGFLPFEAEITDLVAPGESAWLEIEVTTASATTRCPWATRAARRFSARTTPASPA